MIQICVLDLFVLEPGLSSCEFGRVVLAKNINKILTPTGWLRLNLKHKMMAWGQGARREKKIRGGQGEEMSFVQQNMMKNLSLKHQLETPTSALSNPV